MQIGKCMPQVICSPALDDQADKWADEGFLHMDEWDHVYVIIFHFFTYGGCPAHGTSNRCAVFSHGMLFERLSSLLNMQTCESDFQKYAYWTEKLDPTLPEIHMGDRCIFMENIFSEGHRRLNTAPALCMQRRTLKYACSAGGLWQWLQMSKKSNIYICVCVHEP